VPAFRRRIRRRRGLSALLIAVACLVVGGVAALVASGGDAPTTTTAIRALAPRARRRSPSKLARHLSERTTGGLAAPVQDAAAVALGGGRAMLLGGLTAADVSRDDVVIATRSGDRAAGRLPTAVHDTAAVRFGRAVYLFGGGTNAGTQSDEIVRVPAAGGTPTIVGRLPAPSSDQSAAAIAGTAYVVGGYTGSRWLDTIVAWRPGSRARVVARLPFPLRYAAVTAVAGRIVIAGGSLENGTASAALLEYTPGGRVVRIGRLPAPTTHAAAAALGEVAYVIGGRGAPVGSTTARIVAIDAHSGRVHPAGSLAAARSDLSAISFGDRILLAGGRTAAGAVATLGELVPAPARATRTARTAKSATAHDVYAFDGANMLTGATRFADPLVYVPNSESDTVTVIDPATYKVVDTFRVGGLPQHVVPAWDLKTLYVTNDTGNSLTPIDPRTGKREGAPIPVDDPYNMYVTPNGRYAIVVAERLHRLDFRDAHSFRLHHSLAVPCSGVDHMDFTADGRFLLASCEFSGQMVVVDVARERVVRTIDLPAGGAMPQDVRLSNDGRTFYVADMHRGGVWEIDARDFRVLSFLPTGAGAHGLYPSRNGKLLYVSNRSEGSISVISFRAGRQVAKWRLPGGGSPDMGGVSADGKTLWLSGRYSSEVYAISTRTGKLLARIQVGAGPHGLCVWPQPGRYSLGHTDNMR
jgi:YVTN family beta-propeller protein